MTPKGGIRPHKRFTIQAKRSEILFVDYFIEHLNPGGKAGFIVPEGIMYAEYKTYAKVRRLLVESGYLYAIVSMPSGVFKPYASVKTNLLFLDRDIAKKSDSILFVDVENDGFSLSDTRKPINENDLPFALSLINHYKANLTLNGNWNNSKNSLPKAYLVKKNKILKTSQCHLIGRWYKIEEEYEKANKFH